MGLSLEAPCPCRLSSRVWVAGPGSHSVNTAEPGSPAGSLQPRPVGRRLRWGLHSHCPWPGGRALGCCQGQVTSAALLSDVRTKEWRGMGGVASRREGPLVTRYGLAGGSCARGCGLNLPKRGFQSGLVSRDGIWKVKPRRRGSLSGRRNQGHEAWC